MQANTHLAINQPTEPKTARLLDSAAFAVKRKVEEAAPPEVVLKKKFLGLENGLAIYLGIALAALVIIPLAHVAVRAKIAELLGLLKPKTEVVHPAPIAPPPIQPVKIPLPTIQPDMFKVTSISLGVRKLRVIIGK